MTDKNQTLSAHIRQMPGTIEATQLLRTISEDQLKCGNVIYETNHQGSRFSQLSLVVTESCIVLHGKGEQFCLRALNDVGQALLPTIAANLPEACHFRKQTDDLIEGELAPDLTQVALEQRLHADNHTALIRQLLLPFQCDYEYEHLPIGPVGAFAYDFIRQFEALPAPRQDELKEQDYIFYLPSQCLVSDHKADKTYFISLYPSQAKTLKEKAIHHLSRMINLYCQAQPLTTQNSTCGELKSDTSAEEYNEAIATIKQHITDGDAFQVVFGRMLSADFSGSPLSVYQRLKKINPSPYCFYMADEFGTVLGCSPELAVRVSKHQANHIVEIHPIAGTKPRGLINGQIDPHLEQRYSIAMQVDEKELAEHTMLIDLARNDIASIAHPGSTRVNKAYQVQKFSHVQHLVSEVSGILQPQYDALTAYLATMNMGTLTGAPKPSALAIINRLEANARGYFGGGFGFITHRGEMETSIMIRTMRIKNNKVYIRAGGGIVADSIASYEWQETHNKANACTLALKEQNNAA